jgi:cell division protein ZapA
LKQSIEVEIAGQRLVIRSDQGPAYVQELADYVDAQLRAISSGRAAFNLQRAALLVAIQLADDLFREKDLHRRLRQKVEAKLSAIDQALRDHETRIAALAEPDPSEEPGEEPGDEDDDDPE